MYYTTGASSTITNVFHKLIGEKRTHSSAHNQCEDLRQTTKRHKQRSALMLNQDSQEVCEISQSIPSSLQEAFFNQEQQPALSESNEEDSYSASSPSEDSVDAAHFKLFQE